MFIGIVGKPSCGKSTFFRSATLAEAETANYPFTTIKPNHAIAFVKIPDVAKDYNKSANPREGYVIGDYRFVPVDLMDVAGLVPGAHEGKGMGSQFLDDLRQADALVHVVDASGSVNEVGEPVPVGSYDPLNDIKFLEDELDFWYLNIMKRGWEKFSRTLMQEKSEVHKALAKQLSAFKVTEDMVKDSMKSLDLTNKKPTEWSDENLLNLSTSLRKKTKPMVIAANKADVPEARENIKRLQEKFPNYKIFPCSAESEFALREAAKHEFIKYIPGDSKFEIIPGKLNPQQEKALNFIQSSVLDQFGSTGVQNVLDCSIFEVLEYIAIHPGGVSKLEDSKGNVLPDCFLMPNGSTALDFAFKLHTDFGKNFIRAIDVKTKMTVGKDHKLKHTDIVEIVADR